ncbi:uncharacterized protein LOC116939469 [Petromyzon marinus]|uniref:Uncharacterized protein LOC116939469 isoform X1 n=2 Tax=Petromyzon marinus TaxID=7757 RepID=A0AAJ7SR85_PETMA|nr:uncharacterized protein LOC116939469 isoform X1 [Petromyzon marinus]XP_032803756.1 uncharacterized protein LOC116939469 isoform X1 [Petromyzon marinus]XP_032803758.1 uncharacterized protein LOC116939469 isoform X1 [Petromyzon marinus]XP_032803759.1 uncharacterized protein LOC116939469 isoform X1 [Petromyzon marinus]
MMDSSECERPVSLSSTTSSSSSSRDSHCSFGSNMTLASSLSTSQNADTGSTTSSSSSSSRDSRSMFGSSVTLASSLSASQNVDSGCSCSDKDSDTVKLDQVSPNSDASEQNRQPSGGVDEHADKWNVNLSRSNSRRQKDFATICSESSESPVATDAMVSDPKLSYVDRVVLEVLQTEQMYVKDLRSIVENYLGCIIDTPDLPLSPEEVCTLFGNIEDIYALNSELLHELESCAFDPVAIADCFVAKNEAFHIYTQYCMNYPNAIDVLNECARSVAMTRFFGEVQASLKHSLPLGCYLLKPVQRILKYHLLLREIANHYEGLAEGMEVIEEATATMTSVAWHINDIKRKHEHAARVQEIQAQLVQWQGPELCRYGELVLEGTFRVHRARHERSLFLFHCILLLTKRRDDAYAYKAHILCSNLMLVEHVPKEPLSFSVRHFKNSKVQHTVQARSFDEKRLWIHELKRLILENHPGKIPLKAKQAILEMDAFHQPHAQPVPPTTGSFALRRGRRKSEPATRKARTLEPLVDLRMRSGSVGELLSDSESFEPSSSSELLEAGETQERHSSCDGLDSVEPAAGLLCRGSMTSLEVDSPLLGPRKYGLEKGGPPAAGGTRHGGSDNCLARRRHCSNDSLDAGEGTRRGDVHRSCDSLPAPARRGSEHELDAWGDDFCGHNFEGASSESKIRSGEDKLRKENDSCGGSDGVSENSESEVKSVFEPSISAQVMLDLLASEFNLDWLKSSFSKSFLFDDLCSESAEPVEDIDMDKEDSLINSKGACALTDEIMDDSGMDDGKLEHFSLGNLMPAPENGEGENLHMKENTLATLTNSRSTSPENVTLAQPEFESKSFNDISHDVPSDGECSDATECVTALSAPLMQKSDPNPSVQSCETLHATEPKQAPAELFSDGGNDKVPYNGTVKRPKLQRYQTVPNPQNRVPSAAESGAFSTLNNKDRLLLQKIKSFYENFDLNEESAMPVSKKRESMAFIPKGVVKNSVLKISSLAKNSAHRPELKLPSRSLLRNSGNSAGLEPVWETVDQQLNPLIQTVSSEPVSKPSSIAYMLRNNFMERIKESTYESSHEDDDDDDDSETENCVSGSEGEATTGDPQQDEVTGACTVLTCTNSASHFSFASSTSLSRTSESEELFVENGGACADGAVEIQPDTATNSILSRQDQDLSETVQLQSNVTSCVNLGPNDLSPTDELGCSDGHEKQSVDIKDFPDCTAKFEPLFIEEEEEAECDAATHNTKESPQSQHSIVEDDTRVPDCNRHDGKFHPKNTEEETFTFQERLAKKTREDTCATKRTASFPGGNGQTSRARTDEEERSRAHVLHMARQYNQRLKAQAQTDRDEVDREQRKKASQQLAALLEHKMLQGAIVGSRAEGYLAMKKQHSAPSMLPTTEHIRKAALKNKLNKKQTSISEPSSPTPTSPPLSPLMASPSEAHPTTGPQQPYRSNRHEHNPPMPSSFGFRRPTFFTGQFPPTGAVKDQSRSYYDRYTPKSPPPVSPPACVVTQTVTSLGPHRSSVAGFPHARCSSGLSRSSSFSGYSKALPNSAHKSKLSTAFPRPFSPDHSRSPTSSEHTACAATMLKETAVSDHKTCSTVHDLKSKYSLLERRNSEPEIITKDKELEHQKSKIAINTRSVIHVPIEHSGSKCVASQDTKDGTKESTTETTKRRSSLKLTTSKSVENCVTYFVVSMGTSKNRIDGEINAEKKLRQNAVLDTIDQVDHVQEHDSDTSKSWLTEHLDERTDKHTQYCGSEIVLQDTEKIVVIDRTVPCNIQSTAVIEPKMTNNMYHQDCLTSIQPKPSENYIDTYHPSVSVKRAENENPVVITTRPPLPCSSRILINGNSSSPEMTSTRKVGLTQATMEVPVRSIARKILTVNANSWGQSPQKTFAEITVEFSAGITGVAASGGCLLRSVETARSTAAGGDADSPKPSAGSQPSGQLKRVHSLRDKFQNCKSDTDT